MANYKVGDIIRLSRNFIGMSQEELAFQAGLATETISRIESGKYKISTETYKKLMGALNRFPERSFAICSRSDMEIIEEKKLLEEAEVKHELDDAEYYLSCIKKQIGDNEIDRQYVRRIEAILNYYDKKDTKAFIEDVKQTLCITIKDWDYEIYKGKKYPYTEQELLILMNLADAYGKDGQCEKSEEISEMILEYLDEGYISSGEIDNFKLTVKRNLTITYQKMGRYEESLKLLQQILNEATALKYGSMITISLFDIAWNMAKLNEIYKYEHFQTELIKEKLIQAYYVAGARNDNYIKNLARDLNMELFNTDIKS